MTTTERPVFGVTAPVRKGSVFRDGTTVWSEPAVKLKTRKKPISQKPCCTRCEGLGGNCVICGFKLHDDQAEGICGVCTTLLRQRLMPGAAHTGEAGKPYDGRYDDLIVQYGLKPQQTWTPSKSRMAEVVKGKGDHHHG